MSDALVASVAGLQNSGALLVKTLPVAIVMLGILSLGRRARNAQIEAVAVPSWTRGLGWSALALLVLIGAQTMLSHLVWIYVIAHYGTPAPASFDFALPRLVALLPGWAFGFATVTALVSALWASIAAARRARGDKSLLARLRGVLDSNDERTGSLDLSPMLQLIGLVGFWCAAIALLGAWFFFPQQGALEASATETLHDQMGGFALALFAFIAVLPALFLRDKALVRRANSNWRQVAGRFLAAHLALTTGIYLLLSLSGAFLDARFESQWARVNEPQSVSGQR